MEVQTVVISLIDQFQKFPAVIGMVSVNSSMVTSPLLVFISTCVPVMNTGERIRLLALLIGKSHLQGQQQLRCISQSLENFVHCIV